MTLLIGLIAGFVFLGVLLVVIALVADERRLRVQERVQLMHASPRSPLAEELALPFQERIILPIVRRVVNVAGALAPNEALELARVELERAGNPGNLSPQTFMVLRGFSALAGAAGAYWLFKLPSMPPMLHLIAPGVVLVVGIILPHYLLEKAIQTRHAQVRRALPDIIDLLVVSVEAGAGLDGALAEVVSRKDGPLPDEFRRLLGEVRVGKTRKQAWQDMADRVAEDNLSALVASLTQAEQLGVSIAKALRTQADSLRTRRSLEIREMAAALPVKMLFPLIFFIFPALFIIGTGAGAAVDEGRSRRPGWPVSPGGRSCGLEAVRSRTRARTAWASRRLSTSGSSCGRPRPASAGPWSCSRPSPRWWEPVIPTPSSPRSPETPPCTLVSTGSASIASITSMAR